MKRSILRSSSLITLKPIGRKENATKTWYSYRDTLAMDAEHDPEGGAQVRVPGLL